MPQIDIRRPLATPVPVAALPRFSHDVSRALGWPNWNGDGVIHAIARLHAEISDAQEAPYPSVFAQAALPALHLALDLGFCEGGGRFTDALLAHAGGEHPDALTLDTLALARTRADEPFSRAHILVSRALRAHLAAPDGAPAPDDFFAPLANLVRLIARTLDGQGFSPDEAYRAHLKAALDARRRA